MRSASRGASVSVRLIWPFVRVMGSDPGVPRLLAEAGLSPHDLVDADGTVPRRALMRLLAGAVALTNDPALGLKAAENLAASDLGALEYAVRSCATLREATRCAMRYIRLLHEAANLSLEERDDLATLRFRTLDGVIQEPAANDFEVAVFVGLARRYTGAAHERPLEVHLAHATPSGAAEYERVFGCVPRMGMPHNAIVFPRWQLDVPLVHADSTLHSLLDRHLAHLLAQHRDNRAVANRVRALLLANLSAGHTTLGDLAKALAMSRVTLRRRLEDLGTTHSELLDQVRRELAERYLADATLTLDDVAFLLGYGHSRNFFKAFRRWFNGKTPGQIRAQLTRKTSLQH